MKKLLFVFAISAFAACGGNSETATSDSTATTTVDTTATVAPAPATTDTAMHTDSAAGTMSTDTTHK